jgi:two-component system chemotaxis response regulator CheB
MRKIRVLVVDDAVVVRRLVTDALASDPMLEVVGAAANGRIALAKIPQLNPDLITLDIEMPEMNGFEVLVEVRKSWPRLPVVIFSNLTERGAASTLEALALGATDYVTKPVSVGSVSAAQQRVRDELIPRIKALCGRAAGHAPVPPARFRPTAPLALPVRPAGTRVDLLAIGVSTGGPNALAAMLPAFPADFPVPIVIVQHMPPLFTRFLADRLTQVSSIRVREGVEGGLLEPGVAWVAPGNYHMVLRQDGHAVRVQLHQGSQENSCRPSVDVLFRSVAEVYGAHALGVVLTGMGQDGLRGSEDIRQVQGQIVVQDEATSVVWGMPGFVANAGLAEAVLPLPDLPGEIMRRAWAGRPNRPPILALHGARR